MSTPTLRSKKEPFTTSRSESVTVRGAGELGGGTYSRVLILGSGEVSGDLCADRVRSMGSGEFHGRVEATTLSSLGSGEIGANLVAGQVRAFGALAISSNAEAERFSAFGACEIGGRVLAEEMKILGLLQCKRVEAGAFRIRGTVEIDELLSGDHVEIRLSGGQSRIGQIGGKSVEIWGRKLGKRNRLLRAVGWILGGVGLIRRQSLRVEIIEADRVTVECTTADVIRGRHVDIGPSCHVGCVEYAETLDVHKDSVVTKRERI